ncbi:sigma-70 family RNA polymerase sigma factor [Aquisalibacillus elongatus]|uniref:RNA polymerase sigma-70 factor (ECF subfamily) n=1 Tax=Aquisalibacillus elongatus TaxID=485577 RepID=A0A3N5BY16_9BACI|nr:sigma-70 family RNA polymerase sigma factor [Aquisalibacillus elongatus]RPF52052.1 RNA polymerase sigma-70 factor (ECF subfamily) [Aquisalibacillus elongatus]
MAIIKLVKKAQKGDEQAYIQLFQQFEADIYRTAFVYVNNQEDALDVVQEVAYRSFKKIKSLKQPKYFKTWLIRITIRCAVDLLNKRKKVVQLNTSYEELIEDEQDLDLSLALSLEDIINQLAPNEKSVVLLKYYYDYTFQEISDVLEIPLGSAKSLLYRAIRKLRKDLEGSDFVE